MIMDTTTFSGYNFTLFCLNIKLFTGNDLKRFKANNGVIRFYRVYRKILRKLKVSDSLEFWYSWILHK